MFPEIKGVIFKNMHIILVYTIDKVYTFLYNGGVKELIEMLTMNATEVRKNWSEVSESVIREKPKFIKKNP